MKTSQLSIRTYKNISQNLIKYMYFSYWRCPLKAPHDKIEKNPTKENDSKLSAFLEKKYVLKASKRGKSMYAKD